jgi:hypothetical protein
MRKKFIHSKRVNGKTRIKNLKCFIEFLVFAYGTNYAKRHHYNAFAWYKKLTKKEY